MASPIEEFFDQLGRHGHEPLLAKASGTVRFEVVQGLCTEHWYLTIDKGDLGVTRENVEADVVVRASRELFDRVAGGAANLQAAVLRGEASVEGKVALLIMLARLFPGPESPREQRVATARGRR